ncbi:sugar transferase [Rheinheimera sp.]|uniref:sugar transferase n=1 Tax=Rheinheimera sp. TaxID=1869214 RepID=UPI004047F45E
MKRFIDITLAVISVVFFMPLMAIAVISILISDRGPIFYKQIRVGLHGKEFHLFKFRTMCVDADKVGPYFTASGDKRITRIGKFLRKTSIDELPQILNVIKGDMSIVGPRPNVPQQKQYYSDFDWQLRHSVRPGITGLAQSTLRSLATEEERLNLDLSYVKNNSILGDFKIIVMTVKQVFFKGGN